MRDAVQSVIGKRQNLRSPARRNPRQVRRQSGGAAGGGGQPKGAAGKTVLARQMVGELAQTGVQHESRIPRGDVLDDRRVLLLVADHVAHRGQADGDGVQTVGDAAAERERRKGGHGGGTPS